MERGYCRKSTDECEYIHTVCKTHKEGYCRFGKKCFYVHTPKSRETDARSSIPCKFERNGWCFKGDRCEYRHEQRTGWGQKTPTNSYIKQRPVHQRQGYEEPRYHPQGYERYQQNTNFQNQHWGEEFTREQLLQLIRGMITK